MAKTKSFVDKQQKNLEFMRAYNASFMHLYEKELNDEKEKYLADYKTSHSEEEYLNEQKNQEVCLKAKLEKKQQKLDKKVAKKEQHYENHNNLDKKRIWEIDLVRGIIIIGMLIDHFFFDFIGLFTKANFTNLPEFYLQIGSFANVYWMNPVRITFRLIGIFFLFLLTGISTHFSRNSLKRSFIVIGAGAIISVAFIVVANITGSMNDLVLMGAVMGLGVCMLLYTLFRMAFGRFKKIYKWLVLGVALAILIPWIFISRSVATNTSNFWFYYNGYAGAIPNIAFRDLYLAWHRILIGTAYFGSDWVGLFPNLGYAFLGAFIGETVYKNRKSIFGKYNEKLNKCTKVIIIPGRYSLWFYLLHQVVYIIILGAIALIMGAQLNF